jgi:hypothetical protein
MSAEDTAAALIGFQAALARAQHPLIGALRPGLARDDIRSQTTAAGIRLTDDAVELWAWHDGVDPDFIERPLFLDLGRSRADRISSLWATL